MLPGIAAARPESVLWVEPAVVSAYRPLVKERTVRPAPPKFEYNVKIDVYGLAYREVSQRLIDHQTLLLSANELRSFWIHRDKAEVQCTIHF